MRKLLLLVSLTLLLLAVGCQPPERTTRDGIAALHGYLVAAQGQHPECSPLNHPENQGETQCQVIAKGIASQNLAIDALEVYCAGPAFSNNNGPCQPPAKGTPAFTQAQAKLQGAMAGLNQSTADVKSLLGVK